MPDIFISPDETKVSHKNIEEAHIIPEKSPRTEVERKRIPGHNHDKMSSFSLYPDDVGFETKADNEQVVLLLRQHPIVNLKWIFTTLLLLTGPTLLNVFGVFSTLPGGFSFVISLAWYLVTSSYAIEGFLTWYFNVYFVTSKRVVDVDFYNLINKRISDAELDKIQDVSYSMGGVIRTMFNYGDVFVQTASEVSEFEFAAVPNPDKVVKILNDLMAEV